MTVKIKNIVGGNLCTIDGKPIDEPMKFKEVRKNVEIENPFPIENPIYGRNYLKDFDTKIEYYVGNKELYFGNLETGYSKINIPINNNENYSLMIIINNYLYIGDFYSSNKSFIKIDLDTKLITRLSTSEISYCNLFFYIDNKIFISHTKLFIYNINNNTWTQDYYYPPDFPLDGFKFYFYSIDKKYVYIGTENNTSNLVKTADGNTFENIAYSTVIDSFNLTSALDRFGNIMYFLDNTTDNNINTLYEFNLENDFCTTKEIQAGKNNHIHNISYINITKDNEMYLKSNLMYNEYMEGFFCLNKKYYSKI